MLYVISASPFYCDILHLYNIVIATYVLVNLNEVIDRKIS